MIANRHLDHHQHESHHYDHYSHHEQHKDTWVNWDADRNVWGQHRWCWEAMLCDCRRLMVGQAKVSHGGGGRLDTGVEDNLKSNCGDTQLQIVHILAFSTFNINHLQIHRYTLQRETWKVQQPYTAKVHLLYELGYIIFCMRNITDRKSCLYMSQFIATSLKTEVCWKWNTITSYWWRKGLRH